MAQDNPYRLEQGWAKYPAGRKWGSTSGVDVDRDGNIWVVDQRDINEREKKLYPYAGGKGHAVYKFSADGKL